MAITLSQHHLLKDYSHSLLNCIKCTVIYGNMRLLYESLYVENSEDRTYVENMMAMYNLGLFVHKYSPFFSLFFVCFFGFVCLFRVAAGLCLCSYAAQAPMAKHSQK